MTWHNIIFTILFCLVNNVFAQETSLPIAAWSRTIAMAEDIGSPVDRGAAVFNNWCMACHSRDLKNASGTLSLEYKYQGKTPAVLQDREDLTVEFIKLSVRNGVATMPIFRPTEISDEDLDALAVYLSHTQR